MCVCVCVCVYHTITDVYTTALLLTNPSSDDDSGFSIHIYIYIYLLESVVLCKYMIWRGIMFHDYHHIRYGLNTIIRSISYLLCLHYNIFILVYYWIGQLETSHVSLFRSSFTSYSLRSPHILIYVTWMFPSCCSPWSCSSVRITIRKPFHVHV